jgi:hypothetical protein
MPRTPKNNIQGTLFVTILSFVKTVSHWCVRVIGVRVPLGGVFEKDPLRTRAKLQDQEGAMAKPLPARKALVWLAQDREVPSATLRNHRLHNAPQRSRKRVLCLKGRLCKSKQTTWNIEVICNFASLT